MAPNQRDGGPDATSTNASELDKCLPLSKEGTGDGEDVQRALATKDCEPSASDVSEVVGRFGRYHLMLLVVNVARAVPIGWTLTSVDFLAGDVSHRCAYPPGYENDDDLQLADDVCFRYEWSPGSVNRSVVVACTNWTYDLSQPSSAVVEWNLVCGRTWMRSVIQSVAFVGQLCGALFFGKLADRFGRLIMFDVAAISMVAFGAAGAWAADVQLFNLLRFVQAMSTAGLQTLAAALYSEVALPADRNYLHLGMTLGAGATQMLLPGMAKWLNNWRHVQLATGLSAVTLLPFLFLMHESPRWLLTMGHHAKAERALAAILRFNGRDSSGLGEAMPTLVEKVGRATSGVSVRQIWRHLNLRRNLFAMFVFWGVNSTMLFGIAYLPVKLGGDRFFNFTLVSSSELPAGFVGLYVIRKFRRRDSLTVLMTICCAALLGTAILPFDWIELRLALLFVARFCVVLTTAVMWVFTMELLPTPARGFGLAVCFFVGRGSAALAPFLRDLADIHNPSPFLVLAALATIGGLVVRIAPETLGRPLPDSLREADAIGARRPVPAASS